MGWMDAVVTTRLLLANNPTFRSRNSPHQKPASQTTHETERKKNETSYGNDDAGPHGPVPDSPERCGARGVFVAECWLTGADLSAVVEARQRLDSQLQENKSVQKVQSPPLVYMSIPSFFLYRDLFGNHIANRACRNSRA